MKRAALVIALAVLFAPGFIRAAHGKMVTCTDCGMMLDPGSKFTCDRVL